VPYTLSIILYQVPFPLKEEHPPGLQQLSPQDSRRTAKLRQTKEEDEETFSPILQHHAKKHPLGLDPPIAPRN